jgi:hypothetical protein
LVHELKRVVSGPVQVDSFKTVHALLLLYLRISRREGHPVGELSVEADLEGILSGPGKRYIKHQHGTSLNIDHSRGRLAELHGALAPQELTSALVYKAYPDGVYADLGAAAPHPKHQVSAGIDRGKVGEPDVLKHAEHTELALLVDQGVVGDDGEIEVQFRKLGLM